MRDGWALWHAATPDWDGWLPHACRLFTGQAAAWERAFRGGRPPLMRPASHVTPAASATTSLVCEWAELSFSSLSQRRREWEKRKRRELHAASAADWWPLSMPLTPFHRRQERFRLFPEERRVYIYERGMFLIYKREMQRHSILPLLLFSPSLLSFSL